MARSKELRFNRNRTRHKRQPETSFETAYSTGTRFLYSLPLTWALPRVAQNTTTTRSFQPALFSCYSYMFDMAAKDKLRTEACGSGTGAARPGQSGLRVTRLPLGWVSAASNLRHRDPNFDLATRHCKPNGIPRNSFKTNKSGHAHSTLNFASSHTGKFAIHRGKSEERARCAGGLFSSSFLVFSTGRER